MTDEKNNRLLDIEEDDSYEDGSSEPLTGRERIREQLASEVAEFLARGGCINHIESRLLANPPRKPPCNYGSQPL